MNSFPLLLYKLELDRLLELSLVLQSSNWIQLAYVLHIIKFAPLSTLRFSAFFLVWLTKEWMRTTTMMMKGGVSELKMELESEKIFIHLLRFMPF